MLPLEASLACLLRTITDIAFPIFSTRLSLDAWVYAILAYLLYSCWFLEKSEVSRTGTGTYIVVLELARDMLLHQ